MLISISLCKMFQVKTLEALCALKVINENINFFTNPLSIPYTLCENLMDINYLKNLRERGMEMNNKIKQLDMEKDKAIELTI